VAVGLFCFTISTIKINSANPQAAQLT